MTATTETPTIPEAVKTAVAEWSKAYPNGVPVLYWPHGDREYDPDVEFAYRPHAGEEPMVMLHSTWKPVPMSHVEPHPLAAEVAALPKPEVEELYFPNPPCPFCNEDTFHNGDDFECGYCGASFDSHSNCSTRRCVEDCDDDATVVGADKQPRCLTCEVRVRAGEYPTGPYQCRQCRTEVVGIPQRMDTYKRKLCPHCLSREQQRAFVDEILSRRS